MLNNSQITPWDGKRIIHKYTHTSVILYNIKKKKKKWSKRISSNETKVYTRESYVPKEVFLFSVYRISISLCAVLNKRETPVYTLLLWQYFLQYVYIS